MWVARPRGQKDPIAVNTMNRDACKFIRRFIHFADNERKPKAGSANYSPLFKIEKLQSEMMAAICSAYTAGKWVTLDESMVKYKGRAVKFVQYMPAKPIKVRLNCSHFVFSCCLRIRFSHIAFF